MGTEFISFMVGLIIGFGLVALFLEESRSIPLCL